MTTPKLLGLAEVADLYSISKNSANAWTRRHDFPAPIARLAMGPVWDRDAVVAWRPPVDNYSAAVTSPNGQVGATIAEQRQCTVCWIHVDPTPGSLWTDMEGQLMFKSTCENGHESRHYISLKEDA